MANLQIKRRKIAALGIIMLGPLVVLGGLWIWTKDGGLVFLLSTLLIPMSLAFLIIAFEEEPVVWKIRDKLFSPWERLKEDFEKSPPRIQGILMLLFVFCIVAIIWLFALYQNPNVSKALEASDPY